MTGSPPGRPPKPPEADRPLDRVRRAAEPGRSRAVASAAAPDATRRPPVHARFPFATLLLTIATVPSRASEPVPPAPVVLDPVALDRVTAGSNASAELAPGDAPRARV